MRPFAQALAGDTHTLLLLLPTKLTPVLTKLALHF